MRIAANAPGKVVLSGEYAVLEGAPAICAAVDRRAVVTIETHAADHHVVTAPGFSAATGCFTADRKGLTWQVDGEDFGLFEATWNVSRPSPAGESLAFTLDTAAFRDPASGNKLGLGSSAALTAALAAALHALGGGPVADVAHAAHRDFQGGSGSGVDVACSVAGGVIEYRLAEREAAPIEWPDGLYYSILWSGVPAGTPAKLARLGERPDSAASTELADAARAAAAAFAGGDAAGIVAELERYRQVLERFDEAHGLGIFDAGHSSLAKRAARQDLVYKPCGAGGGDVGVALATDRSSLASFEQDAVRAGFRRLALSIDPRGAMLYEKEQP